MTPSPKTSQDQTRQDQTRQDQTRQEKSSRAGGAEHHVHIHVDDKGFRYAGQDGNDAGSIRVRTGDNVSFHCGHGNYSVLFKNESPFGVTGLHGSGNKEASAVVEAQSGSYKYGVTVSLPAGFRTDDPEIIVDNSGN
jgi:hypothetical protein